jgi:hypothetical protein
MPEIPDAPFITREQIVLLANLYDAFYHCLDDLSPEADIAERQFYDEVASLWASITTKYPSLTYPDFRRKIIEECRKHLRATNRLPSI